MISMRLFRACLMILPVMSGACSLMEETPKKNSTLGLIATPATYYSTQKARYLGGKYKENLDRLVERIVRNAKTGTLQFANNISSVGGIGFFTHSATQTSDERYLEVVVGTAETFEMKGDFSAKIDRLFTLYGMELVSILVSDSEIFQEKEVRGYGVNFTWRNVLADAAGNRVTMERAIIYFPKERVRGFLRQEIDQNAFLRDAVIFTVEEDGPLNLVSFRPQQLKPDIRAPIREDNLADLAGSRKPALKSFQAPTPQLSEQTKAEQPLEAANHEAPVAKQKLSANLDKSNLVETKAPVKPAAEKAELASAKPSIPTSTNQEGLAQQEMSETLALDKGAKGNAKIAKATERKLEAARVAQTPIVNEPQVVETPPPPPQPAQIAKVTNVAPTSSLPPETQSAPKAKPPIAPLQAARREQAAATKLTPAVETKKIDVEPRVTQESAKPSEPAVLPKIALEPQKQEKPPEVKPIQPVEVQTPPVNRVDQLRAVGEKKPESATVTAKAEIRVPVVKAAPPAVAPSPQEIMPAKASDEQLARLRNKPPEALPKKKPESTPAAAKTEILVPEVKLALTAVTPMPQEKAPASLAGAQLALPRNRPDEGIAEKQPQASMVAAKAEIRVAEVKAPPPAVVAPVPQEKAPPKPAAEQLALLRNKPNEAIPEKKPIVRPAPKSLQGYIIQLAFSDKGGAQSWAETLDRRGYAVSLTEADGAGSIRLRLGNFPGRDEAERQLRTLRKEGLTGIVISLPQGYRPEVQPAPSGGTGTTVSAAQ